LCSSTAECVTSAAKDGLGEISDSQHNYFLLYGAIAQMEPRPPLLKFLDHTQLDTHTHISGRTPLKELSALTVDDTCVHTKNTNEEHP